MLPAPLRSQLIDALLKVPNTNTRTRRDTLLTDLPSGIVDGLTRDDAARVDWLLVVNQLDKLGRLVATGERPLIVVAQAALPWVEGTDAGRQFDEIISALEEHYGPGKREAPPTLSADLPAVGPRSVPEAVILGDARVPFAFVQRALNAGASVARLAVRLVDDGAEDEPVLGTAWVIAPGLLITNYHVVRPAFDGGARGVPLFEAGSGGRSTRAWFDYRIEGGKRDERDIEEMVCGNADLDYAILRFKDDGARKPLRLARQPPALKSGDRLNIVQHPKGGPLKYAIRSNHYVGNAGTGQEHFIRYLTDTDAGSSGSPVLNDAWKVVALHHAWTDVPKQQHKGQVVYVNNEGIAISAILADLRAEIRDEIAHAQGWRKDAPDA